MPLTYVETCRFLNELELPIGRSQFHPQNHPNSDLSITDQDRATFEQLTEIFPYQLAHEFKNVLIQLVSLASGVYGIGEDQINATISFLNELRIPMAKYAASDQALVSNLNSKSIDTVLPVDDSDLCEPVLRELIASWLWSLVELTDFRSWVEDLAYQGKSDANISKLFDTLSEVHTRVPFEPT